MKCHRSYGDKTSTYVNGVLFTYLSELLSPKEISPRILASNKSPPVFSMPPKPVNKPNTPLNNVLFKLRPTIPYENIFFHKKSDLNVYRDCWVTT